MTQCQRCVMDDKGDPTIRFDKDQFCNYCNMAISQKKESLEAEEEKAAKIDEMIDNLKKEGRGKECDCLMGISGGLDSSYLAYLGASKWGLRITAVHVNDGYDTDISSDNIRKLINKTGINYIEIEPDAAQFNALTHAYMRAGVPNLAVPQDNVLFSELYKYARKNDIKYFLSGSNWATESILQRGNTWDPYDVINIKSINKQFGTLPIDRLPLMSNMKKAVNSFVLRVKTLTPLNYVDYTREKAFKELEDYCGFQYYGRKHLENHLTAFLQCCWLPEKFGVDKRKSHLSSLIVSGQMTRAEALKELEEPQYDQQYMKLVVSMMASKMEIPDEEIYALLNAPAHQHSDYRIDKFNRMCSLIYRSLPNKLKIEWN